MLLRRELRKARSGRRRRTEVMLLPRFPVLLSFCQDELISKGARKKSDTIIRMLRIMDSNT